MSQSASPTMIRVVEMLSEIILENRQLKLQCINWGTGPSFSKFEREMSDTLSLQ